MAVRSFSSAFERREKFLYLGKFFLKNLRDAQKRPCEGAALSIEALLGNLGGVRLLVLLREKKNAYLGSFPWTQSKLKGQIWRLSGILARNRAPLSWYQIMGHKGAVYRA